MYYSDLISHSVFVDVFIPKLKQFRTLNDMTVYSILLQT